VTLPSIGRSAVSAEIQVRSQPSPRDVWWTEWHCDRRSHPNITALLHHSHLRLIFALTGRTNGRLGTSKSNTVPEIGDPWIGQHFCLVCTGFKINSTRGEVYCSELSLVQTCLLLKSVYCSDPYIAESCLFFRPLCCSDLVCCSDLSVAKTCFSDLSVA
jgi:hypothetical protein